MIDWDIVAHFKPGEFSHPELLRPEMVYKLDELRGLFGRPLIVSSSWRDRAHNQVIDGANDSAHLADPTDSMYSGIDLTVPGNVLSSQDRFFLLKIALQLEFKRLGLYKRHIHLDIEQRLPQMVLWIGKD